MDALGHAPGRCPRPAPAAPPSRPSGRRCRRTRSASSVGHAVADVRDAPGRPAAAPGRAPCSPRCRRAGSAADFSPMRSSSSSCSIVSRYRSGMRLHQPGVHELLDDLLAQPLDVHARRGGRSCGSRFLSWPGQSRRRCSSRTTCPSRPLDRRAAHRARLRGSRTPSPRRCAPPSRRGRPSGMISPAFSTTTMSPTRMSLLRDLVGVVQAGPADRRAGQPHRRRGGRPASACRSCRPGRRSPRAW